MRLLTPPIYAEHMIVGPEGRSGPSTGRLSILQPPGSYTAKLSVGGEEHSTTFEVLKDPNTAGTEADIGSQVDFLYAIKADMEAGAEAVHQLEALRVQLQTVARFSKDSEVVDAANALEEKVTALEMDTDHVVFDLDTPEAYERLQRRLGGSDAANPVSNYG